LPALNRVHGHPGAVLGSQGDEGFHFDRAAGDQLQAVALGGCSQDELSFQDGKVVADADAWPGAEGDIGVAVASGRAFGGKAFGVKPEGVGPQARVVVGCVGADGQLGTGRD